MIQGMIFRKSDIYKVFLRCEFFDVQWDLKIEHTIWYIADMHAIFLRYGFVRDFLE